MKKIFLFSILKSVLILICLSTVMTSSAQTSKVQFVNNCADSTVDSVDIYINGVLTVTGLGFRNATPYMLINDSVQCAIAVAPKHSTDISQAIYTSTETLTPGTGYYKVISGVVNPANFHPNPNGVSIAFTVYTYAGARDTSYVVVNGVHQNVDLLYHNGSTDSMKTTMESFNDVMFISKNDAYGTFHSNYAYQTAVDNLEFDLNNASTDTTILKKTVGNISNRIGQAGLIFTSGFYTNLIMRDTLLSPIDTSNLNKHLTPSQLTRVLGLYIAWPDGKIDTIQPVVVINTGINEISTNQYHTNFFPNPASDLLSITFDLKSSGNVFAELYDINGRKVASTNSTLKLSGANKLALDISNVENGIYFCSLTVDGQKIVRKISVTK